MKFYIFVLILTILLDCNSESDFDGSKGGGKRERRKQAFILRMIHFCYTPYLKIETVSPTESLIFRNFNFGWMSTGFSNPTLGQVPTPPPYPNLFLTVDGGATFSSLVIPGNIIYIRALTKDVFYGLTKTNSVLSVDGGSSWTQGSLPPLYGNQKYRIYFWTLYQTFAYSLFMAVILINIMHLPILPIEVSPGRHLLPQIFKTKL